MIEHAQLLSLISYDPETGLFRSKVDTRRRKIGDVINRDVTFVQKSGREVRNTQVFVPGDKIYRAGRLAWFYVTGEWPELEIDHRDNDGWNNKWTNFRQATRSQNQANTRKYNSNSSGRKCVFRNGGKIRPWRAQIQKDKRRISLGYFETEEAAHEAYLKAARNLFGEFARAF